MAAPPIPRIILFSTEGCDGAGKGSSKERALSEWKSNFPNCEVLSFREPGGSDLGELCRIELSTGKEFPIPVLQEFFLFFTGRIALWRDIVRKVKALRADGSTKDIIIVLDRTFPSTWAYQIAGRNADEFVTELFNRSVRELLTSMHKELPELEIYHLIFDVLAEEAERRRGGRGDDDSGNDIKQFDESDFQCRVIEGYRTFPDQVAAGHLHPAGMVHVAHVINGNGTKDEVYERMLKVLKDIMIPAAF